MIFLDTYIELMLMQCNILKIKEYENYQITKSIQSEKNVPKFKLINFFLTHLSGLISLNTNTIFCTWYGSWVKKKKREREKLCQDLDMLYKYVCVCVCVQSSLLLRHRGKQITGIKRTPLYTFNLGQGGGGGGEGGVPAFSVDTYVVPRGLR